MPPLFIKRKLQIMEKIKSILDTRAFAVEIATQVGHIAGANIDLVFTASIEKEVIGKAELPKTDKDSPLKSLVDVRTFVYNSLANLSNLCNIAITTDKVEAITDYITEDIDLPEFVNDTVVESKTK